MFEEKALQSNNLDDYNELITRRLHGFSNVDSYYDELSSYYYKN